MNIATHACAPVAAALAIDAVRLHSGRDRLFSRGRLIAIGCAGALPDLLNPHLALSARYSSWTHTLWFVLAAYPVYAIICRTWFRQRWILLTNCLWLATVAHLATDTVSNGTWPLYPWGPVIAWRLVRGGFIHWLRFDLALILATVVLALWTRRLERRQVSSTPRARSPAASR